MNRSKAALENLWNKMPDGFQSALVVIGIIIAAIILLVVGYGFVGTVLLILAIFVGFLLGNIMMLGTSFVVAVFLKTASGGIKTFVGLWMSGEAFEKFFTQLDATGFIAATITIFIIAFLIKIAIDALRSVLASLCLVRITNNYASDE